MLRAISLSLLTGRNIFFQFTIYDQYFRFKNKGCFVYMVFLGKQTDSTTFYLIFFIKCFYHFSLTMKLGNWTNSWWSNGSKERHQQLQKPITNQERTENFEHIPTSEKLPLSIPDRNKPPHQDVFDLRRQKKDI